MHILKAQDVPQALPITRAIQAMRRPSGAFSSHAADVPPRAHLPIKPHDGVTLVMSAFLHDEGGEEVAVKVVSLFDRNVEQGVARLQAAGLTLDPATGSPFWLDYARKLDFDPRETIRSFDDLKRLGHFEDEWLRGGPVRRWVPRALADRPLYVFETGGSTGVPKSRVNVADFQADYEAFGDDLNDDGRADEADYELWKENPYNCNPTSSAVTTPSWGGIKEAAGRQLVSRE